MDNELFTTICTRFDQFKKEKYHGNRQQIFFYRWKLSSFWMVTTKQKKSDKLLHISSDLIDLKFISCQIIESKIVKLLHNFTDVGTVTVDQVETEIKKCQFK